MSDQLHQNIENCQTIEELEGIAGEVHEFAEKRSWYIAHLAAKAKELARGSGLDRLSKIVKPTRSYLMQSGSVWDKFKDLKDDYKQLSYSYFSTLYSYELEPQTVLEFLEEAIGEEMTVTDFREFVAEKLGKAKPQGEQHTCPICGKNHRAEV